MDDVKLPPVPLDPLAAVIGAGPATEFEAVLSATRERLGGRTLWSVNSTPQGGGVAEILGSVLPYLVGAGIDARWLVVEGDDPFFVVTKGIHHLLHGDPCEEVTLESADRQTYEETLGQNCEALLELVAPGDPVILHDPQTLGLAPALADHGAVVIWCCHVGADRPNRWTRLAWDFLRPYVETTHRQVFSRPQYIWEGLDREKAAVIPPCVDALSPKNWPMDPTTVTDVLRLAGLFRAPGRTPVVTFDRKDGSQGEVRRRAEVVEDAPLDEAAVIVTQISRWDPLKDHGGVMSGFAEHVAPRRPAHLVLAGPALGTVSDDPEERSTLEELLAQREELPPAVRSRVHIVCLPMEDADENALMVNALQRRSDVIVQKSLAEGFGLTVAEAMWKGRPVVGSRVGGVQDQIVHGTSGLLLDDPSDLVAFAQAVVSVLDDADCARRLGEGAEERVREEYLTHRYLTRLLGLLDEVLEGSAVVSGVED